MAIAQCHCLFIDRWFYPRTQTMHRDLAQQYESGPRFGQNIVSHGAGLTIYLVAAIRGNAEQPEQAE